MDRDPNYVVVGAFVVLVLFMASSFVFWYTGEHQQRSYQRYEIYFRGTVSGLTQGAPVRYLGVDVGKVWRVLLDPKERNRVEVIADIDSSAPVDGRTLASLNLQGITGLLYVDLERDEKAGVPTPLAAGNEYPIIRSKPSDFDLLLASLPALATRTVELVDRFNRVLSDENMRAFTETLDNARRASAVLPGSLHEVQLLIVDLRRTSEEIQAAAADVRELSRKASPEVEATLANVRHLTERLADTSDHLDQFVAENQPNFTRFTRQSLPQFEQLLRESRAAARDFRDLTRSLKENPAQLLYEAGEKGVELPR
jgi:phospholipid/cholesterol/gamma-HCH transport system substrate-binding protein